MLITTEVRTDATAIVTVAGHFRRAADHIALSAEIATLEQQGVSVVMLDLSQVLSLSSVTGFALVEMVTCFTGVRLALCGLGDEAGAELSKSGMDRFMPLYATLAEAFEAPETRNEAPVVADRARTARRVAPLTLKPVLELLAKPVRILSETLAPAGLRQAA